MCGTDHCVSEKVLKNCQSFRKGSSNLRERFREIKPLYDSMILQSERWKNAQKG